MARTSEPNSLRTSMTFYWMFEYLGISNPYKFLQNYWLLYGFNKIFEVTRDRITIYADYFASNFFMFFSILLLITKQGFIRNSHEAFKRRIFFKLFRGYLRIRSTSEQKTVQSKKKKESFRNYYKQLLTFVAIKNERFIKYCILTCKKVNNTLSLLIKERNQALTKMSNELILPLRVRIADIFSAIDRNYILIWRAFYNFVRAQLWFARNMRYFLSTVKLCFISTFKPNIQLFADHIAFLLKKSRQHWQIIKTITELLQIMYWFTPVFTNIKIHIQGCIADSERTRSVRIGQPFVITQTFLKRLDYGVSHAATPFGTLGVKIWMIHKNA